MYTGHIPVFFYCPVFVFPTRHSSDSLTHSRSRQLRKTWKPVRLPSRLLILMRNPFERETPEELVMAIAEAKADSIMSKLQTTGSQPMNAEPTILITADTAEAILNKLPIGDYVREAEPTLLVTGDQVQINSAHIFLFKSLRLLDMLVKIKNSSIMFLSWKELNRCYVLLLLLNDLEVVVYEGVIREKPSSKEEARQFIKGYSGGQCATVGSVLVTNVKTGFRKGESDRVEINFHEIPDETIEKLVGTMDSVMGLPKALTEKLIKEAL
ncbi:hypothetical protein Patl1_09147 [Pistacia atlantica]|uniref:Uncharacterized protein n=1 Tax=Pistacia atlantica TaxID=434234 RepID=A0ACC1AIB1_9ROSI|nr:hypothetical protein Patl1_09147 [Pistacia atlantica]